MSGGSLQRAVLATRGVALWLVGPISPRGWYLLRLARYFRAANAWRRALRTQQRLEDRKVWLRKQAEAIDDRG